MRNFKKWLVSIKKAVDVNQLTLAYVLSLILFNNFVKLYILMKFLINLQYNEVNWVEFMHLQIFLDLNIL